MIANVIIFPILEFVEPLIVLGLALAVLAIEGAVLWLFNPEAALSEVVVAVLAVNIVSFLLGIGISTLLPGVSSLDLVHGAVKTREGYAMSSAWPLPLVFLTAALISIGVEIGTFKMFLRGESFQRVVVPLVSGNVLSYVFSFVALAVLLAR